MSGTFVPRRGWAKTIAGGPQALVATRAQAERLRDQILENLPEKTGQLKAEWGSMEPQPTRGDDGTVAWRLPIASSLWHLIEFGSINNEAYRPIARAADETGLSFDSGGG